MKIVFLNTLYYPNIMGGAERTVQILAESLYRKGFSPVVITTANRDYVDYVNNVKVYYVKIPNFYWWLESKKHHLIKRFFWHALDSCNFLTARKVRAILKSENPDIVNTNNLLGFSVFAWRLICGLNIPFVHTLRDYYLLCWKSSMFKNGTNCNRQCVRCKVVSFFKKKFSNRVIAVIGVSKFILDRHIEEGYFKNAKIMSSIYNPVGSSDPHFYLKNKEMNLKKKQIIFGFVGSLAPSKGVDFLIKVFFNYFKNEKLYIYGVSKDENYETYLKKKFKSDNIRFFGFKTTAEIYQVVDILIVPSLWHEPFGRVVIEAYSHGVPVVASAVGGLSEIVDDNKTGFLFDSGNEKSLTEKILFILQHREKLAFIQKNCLQKIKEFSIDNIVNEYVEIFYKTISAGKMGS